MDASYYKDLIDSLSSKISIKTRILEKYKDYLPKVQRLIANVSPIALYSKMTESCFEKGGYLVGNETLSHGALIEDYNNLLDAQKCLDFVTTRLIAKIDEIETEIVSLTSELQKAKDILNNL